MNTEFPAELGAHLAGSIRTLRRRYRKRLARCQEKFSENAVHELRIETRRLLAMLDLLDALRVRDSLKKTRRVFKKRLDAFDELRDTHVQLSLLKPLCRDFPEAREFDLVLRRRERRLIGELRHQIKRTKQVRLERRLKALEKELHRAAGEKSAQSGTDLAASALRTTFGHVADLRRRVRRGDTRTIHRLRVSFKRFRYVSELLQPLFPRLTARRLREMQAYQTMMGGIQDIEVLIAAAKQAVQFVLVPAQAVRALHGELFRRRRTHIDAFMAGANLLWEFHPDKFVHKTES